MPTKVEQLFDKHFVAIRNALNDSELQLPGLKTVADQITVQEKKTGVDLAFRDRMLFLLSNQAYDEVKRLVKLCVAAAVSDVCSAITPFLLFADLFNTNPISVCEDMFAFMEETISTLKHVTLFGSGRNTLLRMCNDLLRRLSKSQNTVFCGQIQMFLTRLFPVDEKSGLNLMGNFNLDKDVSYNKDADSSEISGLYTKFWSLQEYFKNPNLCYDADRWNEFTENVTIVLNTFKTMKLDSDDADTNRWRSGKAEFSKYLTSEKLLHLQLMDITFRRSILVQMLIIFQYLIVPVKFKSSSFGLNEEKSRWISAKEDLVMEQLSNSSSGQANLDEASFPSIVKSVMSRELFWSQWKNESCPSFIPADLSKSQLAIKKKRANALVNASGKRLYRFGCRSLDRLPWSTPEDDLEACKSPSSTFKPDLKEYFHDAVLELDPAEKVDEEYQSVNKEEWSWRALRLLSQSSSAFYTSWRNPGLPISSYLKSILTSGSFDETVQPEKSKSAKTRNASSSGHEVEAKKMKIKEDDNPPKLATGEKAKDFGKGASADDTDGEADDCDSIESDAYSN